MSGILFVMTPCCSWTEGRNSVKTYFYPTVFLTFKHLQLCPCVTFLSSFGKWAIVTEHGAAAMLHVCPNTVTDGGDTGLMLWAASV